jgi:hypothetical protein
MSVSHKHDITPFDRFHRNIYKAARTCGVDIRMIANEVNIFGQIFPIHRRGKYKDLGTFHPFDFTPKSHLGMQDCFVSKILHIFFPNLFQNHPVFQKYILT